MSAAPSKPRWGDEDRAALRRLLAYVRPHRRRLIHACLVMCGVAAISGAIVELLGPLTNVIFVQSTPDELERIALAIPAIFFLKLVFQYTQSYLMSWLGQKITQEIREDLFTHLHALSMDFFWKSKSGEVMAKLTNDMNALQSALQFVPLYVIRDSLTVVVMLVVMFIANAKFALLALLVIPIAGGVLGVLGRKLRASSRRGQEVMGDIYHRFQESLQGMLVVKSFNYEAGAIAKFRRENDEFFHQMMRYFRATALSGPLMEFLGSLILALIVWKSGQAIHLGEMRPAQFAVFIGCFFMVYGPTKNLARANSTLQLGLVAAGRIFSVLDEKPSVTEPAEPKPFPALNRGIVFDHVSFRYPGRETWALRDVSLTIEPGKVVALAGPSGSGKTTFVHLLLRLFDPTEGRITIDGVDLREMSCHDLRAKVGLVSQETILFNDTVFGNVAIGREGASRADVESALRTADAAEFVSTLAQGLDTPLGDRGARLSGGQRQRLAIARAVLKDPKLMILDEATSNLDTGSERAVQAALERLFPGRTVAMIAHRLSTVQKADRIVILRNGRVEESGTHAELLADNGVYATLTRYQQLEAPPA
ncbi:MAG: ABC transporter ATP-binding protein [Elusimicrobia bacterium]|nr:ABC transporter ATP-binding protein [Elusimicrobiota bacterium]